MYESFVRGRFGNRNLVFLPFIPVGLGQVLGHLVEEGWEVFLNDFPNFFIVNLVIIVNYYAVFKVNLK